MQPPFIIGEVYSRKDVYKIINVPEDKQGGNWNTGYTTYNSDIFLFVNINSSGRTGHDYDNKFIGDDLQWFSKNTHSLNSPTIQSMLNPIGNIYIFTREDSDNVKFTYQGAANVKNYDDTQPVRILWKFVDEREYHQDKSTEEVINPRKYTEGATKNITVNSYERNPIARNKCIEHYGYQCTICGFDFKDIYGEIGANFIHVHHLKELNSIGRNYVIDPVKDLRPVCPNCHAMLHKRKPAYSIHEMKKIIASNDNGSVKS